MTDSQGTESDDDIVVRRRDILKTVGGAGAVGAFGTGTATARLPDRHIVGMEPGRAGEARRQADQVDNTLDFGHIGQAVVGRWPERALENLERNPHVRYIEEEGVMVGDAQVLPWGVDRVDADVVHGFGDTGDGIHVAVLDSGIRSNHPDLEAHLGEGHAPIECDPDKGFGPCDEAWDDDEGHGTHVAGTVGAIDNDIDVVGVAPEVTLHSVKVLDYDNTGPFGAIADGIRIAADEGYDVANMSLSGGESSTVEDAIQYADDAGVVLVASAGNDGRKDRCDDDDCVGYPAAFPETTAVSSTTDVDTLSGFSSTGPEIDLAAPGSDVLSTTRDGGTGTKCGTSMAAPHVSGAAALLLANGTAPEDVRDELRDAAEDLFLEDFEQGAGLLNVANAREFPQPEAAFTYSPDLPNDGEPVEFDASDSTPEDFIEHYLWDFEGDGVFIAAGVDPSYRYDPGEYDVTLRVTDPADQTDEVSETIRVNAFPEAAFEVVTDRPTLGEPVEFDASASEDEDGEIVEYEWDFGDGTIETTAEDTVEHTYDEGGEKTVRLRVTDDDGASDDEISVHEETVTVSIRVSVEIKPNGNGRDPVNLRSETIVPAAVLHTADFDSAAELDPDTVRFGAPEAVDGGAGAVPEHDGGHVEDVNDSGDDDWHCHFRTGDTGFTRGDDAGKLVGVTHDGVPVFGYDDVRIVGRP